MANDSPLRQRQQEAPKSVSITEFEEPPWFLIPFPGSPQPCHGAPCGAYRLEARRSVDENQGYDPPRGDASRADLGSRSWGHFLYSIRGTQTRWCDDDVGT